MPSFIDQTGRSVDIPTFPTKIVSLVPSQTELLSDLGLDESVAGITKFCVHPQKWFKTKQRIGGTKNPNLEMIRQIQPDLIIANKEENRKEDIEALAQSFPVWVSDINNLPQALQMIRQISEITGNQSQGDIIADDIAGEFRSLRSRAKADHGSRVKVCYLIWQDPFIGVGSDTFIDSMINECGFENVLSHIPRYPEVQAEEIKTSGCEFLLLSSEPYPFKQKHLAGFTASFPNIKPILVDGELFSWYGSRLKKSPRYFQTLIDKLQNATAANR